MDIDFIVSFVFHSRIEILKSGSKYFKINLVNGECVPNTNKEIFNGKKNAKYDKNLRRHVFVNTLVPEVNPNLIAICCANCSVTVPEEAGDLKLIKEVKVIVYLACLSVYSALVGSK